MPGRPPGHRGAPALESALSRRSPFFAGLSENLMAGLRHSVETQEWPLMPSSATDLLPATDSPPAAGPARSASRPIYGHCSRPQHEIREQRPQRLRIGTVFDLRQTLVRNRQTRRVRVKGYIHLKRPVRYGAL